MSDWFVGEIRILPYSRGAPLGWQRCDGSLLTISENEVLFILIGTIYGGDGQITFGVPDLRGRVPVHQGTGRGLTTRTLGELGGFDSVTLTVPEMARHAHAMMASTDVGTASAPADLVLATVPAAADDQFYATAPAGVTTVPFPTSMVRLSGGNQAHDNTAPTLSLQYCIATVGVFPTQS
ncbi:phage tail protein [Sphingomonas ginsenosidivorax]|uniref:Phage tail protein n=1 Tax=Sphingomonas ginsenosidivorax TaxID=862135 RepID=A0A5C6UJM6_9SPHN|nr:tail fiber protein [Sphingomonas ginsenosidivorax]TXC72644.1 phage tail protein [Sphingomonas ginsenosidivorax]